jgi:predicted transcriptional regulator
MKTSELAPFLGAERVQNSYTDREIEGVYTSDLLSDAIANAVDNGILITIQAHKNTVAVATLKDLAAIVICNNRPIPSDMIETARDEGIAVLLTADDQYTVSGKLYKKFNP